MQSFPLFEHDETCTRSDCHNQHYQSCNDTYQTVGGNEADDGSSCRCCCPIDVPPLYSHEFKGLLESLEQWVVGVADFLLFSCHSSRRFSITEYARNNSHSLVGHTEEQWQCLCCCHEEDTCSYNHHDLLLENLLSNCKVLNINTPRKQKQPKETNWKQKFQKPQNENICLTYLNMENNGNYPILAFEYWKKIQVPLHSKQLQLYSKT